MKWLESVPQDDMNNMEGQDKNTTKDHNERQLPRKTLNNLDFLMEWLIMVVKDRDKYVEPSVATVAGVDVVFNEIAAEFQGI